MLAGLGSRVLICTGASSARHAGLLASLALPAVVFPVAAEPTVGMARAAVAAAGEHGADVVAAIGGGSVIDTGKAVAMLLGNGGDPLDYLEVVGERRPEDLPARRAARSGAHHGGHRGGGDRQRGAGRAGTPAQGQPAQPADDPCGSRWSTRS